MMPGVAQAPSYSIALNHTHNSHPVLQLVCRWLEGSQLLLVARGLRGVALSDRLYARLAKREQST